MTGYEYIQASISLFERSLEADAGDKPIVTVTELARQTGYSIYHFTRLFAAVTGVSPKEYISGRILSCAAKKAATTILPLVEIARQSGFHDYESFSRAFKKRFGTAPSRVREARSVPPGCLERATPKPPVSAGAGRVSAPETVSVPAHCVVGLSFFIGFETVSFHKEWGIFMSVQSGVRGRVEPAVFCQYSSWTDDDSVQGLSVLCGLVTRPDTVQPPLFTIRTIPAATYIRFLHTGGDSGYRETYEFIYRDFLAAHDIVPLDLWEFQRYADGGATTEIYIPVALA